MDGRPLLSLLYHLCSDRRLPHVEHLFAYKSPDGLARDLAFLRDRYTPVGHAEVVAHRRRGRALPPNAVEISFDDGFAECFSVVRPLLLEYGIPASFFCVTDTIDNRSMMFRNTLSLCLERIEALSDDDRTRLRGWIATEFGVRTRSGAELRRWVDGLQHDDTGRIDALCARLGLDVAAILRDERPYLTSEELRQLARDGFTLGAHSCSHPRLERLPWEEARREILDSCAAIRELTGERTVPFAIPFGGLGLARDRLASLVGQEQGISLVYDTNDLMRDHPFVVNRIQADDPKGSWRGRSNLGLLIGRARVLEPLRAWRRGWRGVAPS